MATPSHRPTAMLFDLLMAVMDSPVAWEAATGDAVLGMRWRDAVTARMQRTDRYVRYEAMVAEAAANLGLPRDATDRLWEAWRAMPARPDAHAVSGLPVPYAFVTNCSRELARIASARSGLDPRFTLSAEEAGGYKPQPQVYRLACERIGSTPERTCFVAGAAYDAEGALRAGIATVLVRRRAVPASLDPAIAVVDTLHEACALAR